MGAAAFHFRQPFAQATEVQKHLLSLTNLRLSKIKSLYQHLRTVALPGSPFVTTPPFTKLIYQLDVGYPEQVVKAFHPISRTDCVNFYHFVTALTLYSAAHWYYKVKCKQYAVLFSMFDFDQSGGISFDELVIMGSAVMSAACIMAGESPTHRETVTSMMTSVFEQLRGTAHQLSLDTYSAYRLFHWVLREPETLRLFSRNEPAIRYREDEKVFTGLQGMRGKGLERTVTIRVKKEMSEEQRRIIVGLFAEMDDRGSGKLREKGEGYADFINELIMRKIASPMLKKFLPLSHDFLSLSDFLSLLSPFRSHIRTKAFTLQSPQSKVLLPASKLSEYRRLFNLLDLNCNGAVDAEELRRGLEYHSTEETLKLVAQYDFDKSKELQFYEFLKMVAPEEYAIPKEIAEEYLESIRSANRTVR